MKPTQKKKIIVLFVILGLLTLVSIFAPAINVGVQNWLITQNIVSSSGNLLVHFISVGEGDAIAINLPDNKVVLIDDGPMDSNISYTDYILNKVLKDKRNKVIDYLVLTHSDADHVGGSLRLLKNFDVKNVYISPLGDTQTYNEILSYLENGGYNTQLNTEFNLAENGYKFIEFLPQNPKDDNDSCPLIKLEYKGFSFLFSADIPSEQEIYYVNNYGEQLKSDVLKVAHHGSKTSTSAPFVDAVKPSYAVISTDGVSYGHPADTTINTLTDSGAKVFRTDIEGNIMFSLSANNKLAYVYGNIDITPLKIEIRYIILILDAVFVFVIVKIVFFSSKINKHKK